MVVPCKKAVIILSLQSPFHKPELNSVFRISEIKRYVFLHLFCLWRTQKWHHF